jgi:hypothetical protein
MNIQEIKEASNTAIWMLSQYKGVAGQGELGADRVLYGVLEGRFGHMSRQHAVKAGRIDFRFGTSNPVVIEFVLRSPHDPRSKLYESQNRSELRKLTRVRPATAKMRVLLLLDRTHDSIPTEVLRRGYDESNAGRGRFHRHVVRVIYVQQDLAYDFPWHPKASPKQ